MVSTIRYPRAFQDWQARVLRSRTAHIYRISHDGLGNWTATRPGSNWRLYFPADDGAPPQAQNRISESARASKPEPTPGNALTPAEKYAAEVRSSYVNLSA